MLGYGLIEYAWSIRAEHPGRGRFLFVDSIVTDAKSSDHAPWRQGVIDLSGVLDRSDDYIPDASLADFAGKGGFIRRDRNAPDRCGLKHFRRASKFCFGH